MNTTRLTLILALLLTLVTPVCHALTLEVREGALQANIDDYARGQGIITYVFSGNSTELSNKQELDLAFSFANGTVIYIKELDCTIVFPKILTAFTVSGNKITFVEDPALASPAGVRVLTGSKDVEVAVRKGGYKWNHIDSQSQTVHASNRMQLTVDNSNYSLSPVQLEIPEGDPFKLAGNAWKRVLEVNNNLDFEGNPINLGDTKLGALTSPWAGAVAADIHALAGNANIALDIRGALKGFQLDSFPGDGGSSPAPSVCKSTECTAPTTIRWGAWGQGTAILSGLNVTIAPTQQLHYIIGNATTPSVIDARTGTVTYSRVGGTTPTGADGTTYTATVGNITVNFTAATATLAQYKLNPTLSPNTVAYDFQNVPLTLATAGSTKTLGGTGAGLAPGATTGALQVSGFFAGANGQYIGTAMNVTDSASAAISINSVQAFKQP